MDSSEGAVGVTGPCSVHASEIGSSCNIKCKCGRKVNFYVCRLIFYDYVWYSRYTYQSEITQ